MKNNVSKRNLRNAMAGFVLPLAWRGCAALLAIAATCVGVALAEPIDRQALVSRHNPVLDRFDVDSPLSVGNGQFAFTADVTGLQTFAPEFAATTPLGTLSQWGWHTAPNPQGWSIDRFHFTEFNAHGRKVGYADIPGDIRTPEVAWLRANPHRLHLGQIGFRLTKKSGEVATPADLIDIHQELQLWEGVLTSRFTFDGQPVEVTTVSHPEQDAVAIRVASPLVATGQLAIEIKFPYGTGAVATADWTQPAAHTTKFAQPSLQTARFTRVLDNDHYEAEARWSRGGTIALVGAHTYVVTPAASQPMFDFAIRFGPEKSDQAVSDFVATLALAHAHWREFWTSGGAIDLSQSKDPRWRELERRIVLSQYLTAIQCAGSFPPQETGLTYNSWEGKFHLEMHWWHAVHFALWNRWPLFERSLAYYQHILPRAIATANRQGYGGARWPKMTGPTGAESPSTIGPFLIWQQPHPIYYAELAYRHDPSPATLAKYRDIVFATADFMASYAAWDAPSDCYILGPVLQCAQERFPKDATFNPTFELTYWRWGLATAQAWRERLGLTRDAEWDRVLTKLAPPLVVEGKYAFASSAPDSYSNPRWNDDHPAVLGAFGMLPGPGIDRTTMLHTFDWVWRHWNWPNTWGWDYPLAAMSAARLGEPGRAVDALLLDTPKNHFRPNGHNHQRPGLTIYLPGNGGLLTAVAMMAAGWDGAPDRAAPGFPNDGSWVVRYENLTPLP